MGEAHCSFPSRRKALVIARSTILVVADGLAVRMGLKSTLFGGGFPVELASGIHGDSYDLPGSSYSTV